MPDDSSSGRIVPTRRPRHSETKLVGEAVSGESLRSRIVEGGREFLGASMDAASPKGLPRKGTSPRQAVSSPEARCPTALPHDGKAPSRSPKVEIEKKRIQANQEISIEFDLGRTGSPARATARASEAPKGLPRDEPSASRPLESSARNSFSSFAVFRIEMSGRPKRKQGRLGSGR